MDVISTLQELALRLRTDSRAQDLIEYALAAGFVAVAAAGFFPPAIAPALSTIFGSVAELLNDAAAP